MTEIGYPVAAIGCRVSVVSVVELETLMPADVSFAISILDPGSSEPACFRRLQLDRMLSLRFYDVWTEGHSTLEGPKRSDILQLLEFGNTIHHHVQKSDHLLIHCFAGVSRSAAALIVLLAQSLKGAYTARQAFEESLRVRSNTWPNRQMIELGDGLLGLHGTLVQAADEHYAKMAKTSPLMNKLFYQEEQDLFTDRA